MLLPKEQQKTRGWRGEGESGPSSEGRVLDTTRRTQLPTINKRRRNHVVQRVGTTLYPALPFDLPPRLTFGKSHVRRIRPVRCSTNFVRASVLFEAKGEHCLQTVSGVVLHKTGNTRFLGVPLVIRSTSGEHPRNCETRQETHNFAVGTSCERMKLQNTR